jgi:quercetin 2,3-dioxygenase
VRRAFAGVDLATLNPFVHMDQMGEVDYAPTSPMAPPGTPPGASSGPSVPKP